MAPSVAPSLAPTLAPTGEPTQAYVAPVTTLNPAAATVQKVEQKVKVTIAGGVQGYTGATKQVSECAFGKAATVMWQAANGTCYNKPGNDLTSVAKAGRRSAVTITFTILVDSATSETTLTAIVATADAITPTSLTQAVTATIAANPEFASVTAPTVLSIEPAEEIEKVEDDSNSSSGVLVAVIIVCVLLIIAVGIGGFVYYRKTHEAESGKAETEMEDAHTETILIQQAPGGIAPGVLYSVEYDNGSTKTKETDI